MAEEFESLSENRALTRTAAPDQTNDKHNTENSAQDFKVQAQQYSQQASPMRGCAELMLI